MDYSKLKVGKCPVCGRDVGYLEGDTRIECNACDSKISIEELIIDSSLRRLWKDNKDQKEIGYGHPESSLIYIEDLFETYNWNQYLNDPVVYLEDLKDLIDESKRKYGADPSTWLLEFECIYIPILKKLDFLPEIENKMATLKYKDDGSEALPVYAQYEAILFNITEKREELLITLSQDIKYAERFNLDTERINSMKERYESLENRLRELEVPREIYDVKAVKDAQERFDLVLKEEYAQRGISAEEYYNNAVEKYKLGDSITDCLNLFTKISKYKDSSKYIDTINKLYNFKSLYETNGKYYTFGHYDSEVKIVNPVKASSYLMKNAKKLKNSNKKEEEIKQDLMDNEVIQKPIGKDLYEVIGGEIADEPLVRNVIKVICLYGGKFFLLIFDSKSRCYKIVSYDISDNKLTDIDKLKAGIANLYMLDSKLYFSSSKNQFIFRRKLINAPEEVKKGCKTKLVNNVENELNKYEIILVDMLDSTVSTLVKSCIDIYDFYDDKIFYQHREKIEKPGKNKKKKVQDEKLEFKDEFFAYDLKSGVNRKVLDRDCYIVSVYDNKILYTLPNQSRNFLNSDLHLYDLKTDRDHVLEYNIFSFFKIIDGKAYYRVGNETDSSLVSIELDGTGRLEIAHNVSEIRFIRSGWMYFIKGWGYNRVLVKMTLDGKKRVIICTLLNKFIDMIDNLIYYIDAKNNLRIVRNDGTKNRVICDNIDSDGTVIVDRFNIYFLRREVKEYEDDDREEPIYTNSLYSIDVNGRNLDKAEFNVDDIKPFNDDSFFVFKHDTARFKIGAPIGKEDYQYSYKDFNRTRYFLYDKKSRTLECVLTIGNPRKTTVHTDKKGCKKASDRDYTYEEIPVKYSLIRDDVDESLNVKEEAPSPQPIQEQEAKKAKTKKNNSGCSTKKTKNKKK